MEKNKNKKNLTGKIQTEEELNNIEWDYTYNIEFWLKMKFNFLGDYSFILAIFDCCKSFFKDEKALLQSDVENIKH